ncbi:hypothetical protein EJ06DRAFT_555184 [Trichodelitschia bisporula]|uniref:JmjC domain-containing histone demethylation protein 1 n=1 Tax=Trichodelitschia bisporula TaxID=703511 RepID=A0A6G1I2T6_9PEZI|nr:hypothetical protein EJ06DRAFT_555184 [Trichodelitschia bisporula]
MHIPPQSPIDALASVAVQVTSPTFHNHLILDHEAHGLPAPNTHASLRWDAPHQDVGARGFGTEGRPAKRARSEMLPSPQQQSPTFVDANVRPSTSYNMSFGWSYNVEQSIDRGHRLGASPALAQSLNFAEPPILDEKRMSDAELLLGFSRGSSHSLTTASGFGQQRIGPPEEHHSTPVRPYERHDNARNLAFLTSPVIPTPSKHMPMLRNPPAAAVAANPHPLHFDHLSPKAAMQTHTPPDDLGISGLQPSPVADVASLHYVPTMEEVVAETKQEEANGLHVDNAVTLPTTSHMDERYIGMRVPTSGGDAQFHSPQSLPAEMDDSATAHNGVVGAQAFAKQQTTIPEHHMLRAPTSSNSRRQSTASKPTFSVSDLHPSTPRSHSLPPSTMADNKPPTPQNEKESTETTVPAKGFTDEDTRCAGCNFSPDSLSDEHIDWLSCDGCNGWYHAACAGYSARETRRIDKFFCRVCKPIHGATTFLRKSTRVHTSVDYAGLNEGVYRTGEENPEHHYIPPLKRGDLEFLPETFPRMSPEMVTAEYFEKCLSMTEPVVIPAALNPRPPPVGKVPFMYPGRENDMTPEDNIPETNVEYEVVPDDGQDGLDMVIPQGLTVRDVVKLCSPDYPVEVIDVKSQEGDTKKKWTLQKWADYYESTGEKAIRNVISLEVSQMPLGRLIRRPKVVRDMDLQDAVWPKSDKSANSVGFYCLMSVADSYTDFHIDFGGSSVYYHILRGSKVFFFIPPTKANLKTYEKWCCSPAQNFTWLPDHTHECYRVDLSAGDTMLIPSGWIHAVWTPENSLVIGGNFLTRLHYSMQLRVVEVERACRTVDRYKYPHFQKVQWYAVLQYLETDPLPVSVRQQFYEGKKFKREVPVYRLFNSFGHNSEPGPEQYHARYYPKAELDGLPDLVSYIFRTVMIYMNRLDGITQRARDAVIKNIPKGKGDPLEIAKNFAMWAAWKRGNEDIPQWAHPDGVLPGKADAGQKKISAAEMKKLERASAIDASRIPERQSARLSLAMEKEKSEIAGSRQSSPAPASTPKTSVLGPRRTACDVCRKRKMRCKHMDPSAPTSGAKLSMDESPGSAQRSSKVMVAVLIPSSPSLTVKPATVQAPLAETVAPNNGTTPNADSQESKKGRNKACSDCRKSKRRCIHDENGKVDPVKKSEPVVPRGSTKRKQPGDASTPSSANKRVKKEAPNSASSLPSLGHDAIPLVVDDQTSGHEYRESSLVGDDTFMAMTPTHSNSMQRRKSSSANDLQQPREEMPPVLQTVNDPSNGHHVVEETNDIEMKDATPPKATPEPIDTIKVAPRRGSALRPGATPQGAKDKVSTQGADKGNRSPATSALSEPPTSPVSYANGVSLALPAKRQRNQSLTSSVLSDAPVEQSPNGVAERSLQQNGHDSATPTRSRQSSRNPKAVERFTDIQSEHPTVHSPEASAPAGAENPRHSTVEQAKNRRASTGRSSARSSSKLEQGARARTSLSAKAEIKKESVAADAPPVEETDEEKSLRVAMMLQQAEFGLRRRGRE